jgi:hypothetical protein
MASVPKTPRRRAISAITVRDLEGRVWEGDGDGLADAVRDLGERHAQAQAYHVTLTPLGMLALTEADLRAAHPAACQGCPTCRTILPRLQRTLGAAATNEEAPE